jgi:hypothetical protein
MEDVEIHLFRRSLRDSVRSNPKLWKPVEKGFDALIAEDPIRSGSLADALKEVVNRNPRLLDIIEDLLNGPSAIDDWSDWHSARDGDRDEPNPAAANPDIPQTPPTSRSMQNSRSDGTNYTKTNYDTQSTAPEPPTTQNATICNTVASVAFPPAPHHATVCNTATTVDSSDPRDDLCDAPISPPGGIDDRESTGARVASHLSELDEKPPEEHADPTPSKLKVKQQLAITALLGGASMSAAAEAAGIDRSTLYRWMRRDAQFVAAYNRVKHDHYDALHAHMFRITNQMLDALEKLLARPFSTTSDRLRMISVGLQLRKQIMAERAPDCPTDPKIIEDTWRVQGVNGPHGHDFPRPSAAVSTAPQEHEHEVVAAS